MQPNQSNNNLPSIKQPGQWSPLDFSTNNNQPPKRSFFSSYKKLIIVSAVAVVLLVGLAVFASVTSKESSYIEGPKTSVPMTEIDNSKLSLSYPSSLNITADLALEDGSYQFFLAEETDNSPYLISVYVGGEDPSYSDSQDGLVSNLDGNFSPTDIVTSDITLAGTRSQKSVGQIIGDDGKSYKVVYAGSMVGSKFVMVNAQYPIDDTNINDSFDAMLGSIKLK